MSASTSSCALASYIQAKRREGILSHFPSHVGTHFRKYLAASSFAGPFLFSEDVLARVIAASREDSHLDAQLSIAKAFKLPVFRGAGHSDRKASSSQRSESLFLRPLGVKEVVTRKRGARSVMPLPARQEAMLLSHRSVVLPLV